MCPKCGERSDIFGHGGAKDEAEKLGIPFLGGVPLHMDIRATSDEGQPIVASSPDSVARADLPRHRRQGLERAAGERRARASSRPSSTSAPSGAELEVAFEGAEPFTLSAEMLRVMSPSAEVQGHSPDQRVTVGRSATSRSRS